MNQTFYKIPSVKVISLYELSSFYYFVGLQNIVKLDFSMCLVAQLPMDKKLLCQFDGKKRRQVTATRSFYNRLLEIGNDQL